MDREHIRNTFSDYTGRYDSKDIKIRLKIDHTYRVAAICERIAGSLSSEQTDVDLAWLLGMLHDIGRFEQLTRYGSFTDADSIDHAEFGADLLFKEGLFERFISDNTSFLRSESVSASSSEQIRELIEAAIRLHNKYRLPDTLDDRTKLFCQILRDADKIDILKVQVDIPFEKIHPGSKEDLYNSEIGDIMMKSVREHRCASRAEIGKRTSAESYMSHCMLAFELVYEESKRIAMEQGYLAKLLTFRSNNPDTRKKFDILRSELDQCGFHTIQGDEQYGDL